MPNIFNEDVHTFFHPDLYIEWIKAFSHDSINEFERRLRTSYQLRTMLPINREHKNIHAGSAIC